jgi:hypothetical protein
MVIINGDNGIDKVQDGAVALPVASTTVLGGVKSGANIAIDGNGVISANDTSVAFTEITGKPTTLSGYGITDAAPSSHAHTIANVTGLDAALASKISSSDTAQWVSPQINSPMVHNDATASLQVRNVQGASGDGGLAMMSFHAQGAYAIKMGLRADGYFGLGGWSRAAWSWYSDPSGNMTAAGNVTAYSDPRLKDNIRKIENPMDIINSLDGVRYNWNERSKLIEAKWGKEDIGILADQVKAVLPEIVSASIKDDENGETYDTVDYGKLVAVLIEGMKAQQLQINQLVNDITILRG